MILWVRLLPKHEETQRSPLESQETPAIVSNFCNQAVVISEHNFGFVALHRDCGGLAVVFPQSLGQLFANILSICKFKCILLLFQLISCLELQPHALMVMLFFWIQVGNTPMIEAALNGYINIVSQLIAAKADTNHQNEVIFCLRISAIRFPAGRIHCTHSGCVPWARQHC